MILQPFTVQSRGKRYTFIDRLAIDSGAEQERIQQMMMLQVEMMQEDARCKALGINEAGAIGNLGFGVHDGAELVGVFMVAALDYRSGPWADLIDWEVVSGDPAIFHARPMPGFPSLDLADALELSTDAAHHLMARNVRTVGGHRVNFQRFSWAIFKDRTDRNSRAMKRVHDAAAGDARFQMIEAPDPDEPARTRVDTELA